MSTCSNNSIAHYAELHCISHYTFLRGASSPEELVTRADELGYCAIAITDECSVAGAVRAHMEAKERKIKLIIGSEFRLDDGMRLVLLATDRTSYGRLSQLITQGRRNADKGQYRLYREDLEKQTLRGCIALWLADQHSKTEDGTWLARLFPQNTWIAVTRLLQPDEAAYIAHIRQLSNACQLSCVACGDVHMHDTKRRPLQNTVTAIRMGKPLAELGFALDSNGQRYLRSYQTLTSLYPIDWLATSEDIASLCHFSLDELRYEYPEEIVPANHTPTSWLRLLTEQGSHERWPNGVSPKIARQIEHELTLIAELRYEAYFLTVYDIVKFARERGILCQGRGSAANSTVCYCLGITEADPDLTNLLFERFLSKERDEPPDIDVDFEHQRREEVIQYIYKRYGRHRTALAATVVTYKLRSAVRDVGKALGLSLEQINRLTKSIQWWDGKQALATLFSQNGFDTLSPVIHKLIILVDELTGFPRHLSQHVGGFVIARGKLSELVPIENAAMPDRTVIQWEKDDLEALGLLKVDVLSLGMLTAIRKCFDLIKTYSGRQWTMSSIPQDDKAVYGMIQRADTVGVFQIESRAQMSMLPRLKPRNYYDLVIQIAIVRPGPIQGDMVHPYLRRRNKQEKAEYPSEAIREILARTEGVPIFQEQAMQISIVAAGFTPGEADQLRRAMAAWKRKGGLEPYREKLINGMLVNGYEIDFANRIYRMIEGFGDYGFPESHSASFALLAYVSSWLKYHEPAAFCCALLNSQPMGFYRPAQLVNDAQRHNVEIRPIDIQTSHWESTLEPSRRKQPAVRLGLHMVKGLATVTAKRIISQRSRGQFQTTQDLAQRSNINQKELQCLAAANALQTLTGHRYRAYWDVSGVESPTDIFQTPRFNEAVPLLPTPSETDEICADYASTGLTLGRHPLSLLRERLTKHKILQAKALEQLHNGCQTRVAGLVINRQRPMTASGVIFVTLEDETGHANIVVWPKIVERQRRQLIGSRLLAVTGTVQIESNVIHLVARQLHDVSHWLGTLSTKSRDFH